jgi:hypothetical protein
MPSSLEVGVALIRSVATPALLAALPALAALAWFLGGMLPYMILVRRRGSAPDPEVLARGRTLLVGYFLRQYFFWWIGPVWRLLLQSGLPP